MSENQWTWANLNEEQLELIREAEETLGTEYLVVLEEGQGNGQGVQEPATDNLRVASLNESQLECLQGLEKMLNATILAYESAR